MKINDILKEACSVLELTDLKAALIAESLTSAQEKEANKLVEYFNRIQQEISTEFLMVLNKETISANGSISFSSLEEEVLDIICVKDEKGNKFAFKVFPDHVSFDGSASEVLYSFVPEDIELGEDILYLAPIRIYVFGIAREFYFEEGLADKANFFEQRFKNSIESLIEKDKQANLKTRKLPARLWL